MTHLELTPNVGQLLVDPLDLRLLTLAVPDVGDEDGQPSHTIATYSGHGDVNMLKAEKYF